MDCAILANLRLCLNDFFRHNKSMFTRAIPTRDKSKSAFRWITTSAAAIKRAAKNTLLPPICLACENTVTNQGLLCPSCWASQSQIERPWCEILGAPFSYNLGKGVLSAAAIANPPAFDKARSVVLYDVVSRQLIQGFKFSDRTDLGPWLGKSMADYANRIDDGLLDDDPLVIPVPLHSRRLFSRRFNQAAELARYFCKASGSDFQPMLLQRIRKTRQQVGLDSKQRQKNVRGAFRVPTEHKPTIKGRKILLIDDVFTTGATLEACSRALRRAGASRIECLTYARVAQGEL